MIRPAREKKPKSKNDPRLVAAARELRDRYLEEYNSGRLTLASAARYEVGRGQIVGQQAPAGLLLPNAWAA